MENPGLVDPSKAAPDTITPEYRRAAYRRHFQGALVGPLKRNRDQLAKQNLELKEKAETILRAQQDLNEANEVLEQRVQERTRELRASNEQLTREIQDRKEARVLDLYRLHPLQVERFEAAGTKDHGLPPR